MLKLYSNHLCLDTAMDDKHTETQPWIPERPLWERFNPDAVLPFSLTAEHIYLSMLDFTDFLETVDSELVRKRMARIEEIMMPANFSSMVGEFIVSSIPKHCSMLAKNTFHNGHPDLLPAGKYPNNAAQHAGSDGIEVKASRYESGWQGHNAENAWLMVFVFESGRPVDLQKNEPLTRFHFRAVYGALLEQADWQFSGRSATSRRTITASVRPSGFEKMTNNWIYRNLQ
jgi:hypothetical protein